MTPPPDSSPTVLRPRAEALGPLVIPTSPAVIGRGRDVDVGLDDDSVSDRHARLEHRDDRWWITDLGSTNGTRLAGARIAPDTPHPLDDGTEIRLGGFTATFQAGSGETVASPAPTPAAAPPRRTGIRIPVWLVLLVILVIVFIVLGILSMTGTPAGVPAEPPAGAASAEVQPVLVDHSTPALRLSATA